MHMSLLGLIMVLWASVGGLGAYLIERGRERRADARKHERDLKLLERRFELEQMKEERRYQRERELALLAGAPKGHRKVTLPEVSVVSETDESSESSETSEVSELDRLWASSEAPSKADLEHWLH